MRYWCGYLSGARCRLFAYGPADATAILKRGSSLASFKSRLEVCMGMGKTGIPWVPWDSHGNGSKISHGMGMGIKCMGMGVKTWELSPATVNSLLFLNSNME